MTVFGSRYGCLTRGEGSLPAARCRALLRLAACLVVTAGTVVTAPGAELKMSDGRRIAALVDGYDGKGNLQTSLTSGEKQAFSLTDVAAITFSGRPEHFIRTGDQKLIFTAGGEFCGRVESLDNGDTFRILCQSLGNLTVTLKTLRGMTAMAVDGRATRLAEDMMLPDGVPASPEGAFLDRLLDRRGVPYAGVIDKFDPIRMEFEHDEQLQTIKMETFKVAGLRLAEAARDKTPPPDPVEYLRVGIRCRDRSYVVGDLANADPFQWNVRPSFDSQKLVGIPASEITGVDVLGGKTIFLSQLDPVKVEEQTVIAPPQPYRRDLNSLGETLDIGGFIYRKGVGVHARSLLTYRLGGKFKQFLADIGIDGRLETAGSAVFAVQGDGKELYRSPVIRGRSAGGGTSVSLSVEGVNELTLVVEPTDDMDQSDVANWGAARVTR